MKVGRRLAVKVLNATKFVARQAGRRRRRRASTTSTEPLDLDLLAALAELVDDGDRGVRGVRLRAGARAHRVVLLAVLRRLPRAREGPRLRRRRRCGDALGARRRSLVALVGAAATLRAVPPLRDRGGVAAGCTTTSIHSARVADPRRARRSPGPSTASSTRRARCSARSGARSPQPSGRCAPRSRVVTVTGTRQVLDAIDVGARATSPTPASSSSSSCARATTRSSVVLAEAPDRSPDGRDAVARDERLEERRDPPRRRRASAASTRGRTRAGPTGARRSRQAAVAGRGTRRRTPGRPRRARACPSSRAARGTAATASEPVQRRRRLVDVARLRRAMPS